MVILGIDPGMALVGYGIISTNRHALQKQDIHEKPKVMDFGCIATSPSLSTADRLEIIYQEVKKLIKQHQPDVLSIENLFFFKNAKTAMPVSQAKGVILLAAAQHRLSIMEFTPLQVKMTVAGYGKAEKKQIQEMTQRLLDLSSFDIKKHHRKKDDASDALGVALCAFLTR